MNLDQIINAFFIKIREKRGQSRFSDSDVTFFANEVLANLYVDRDWNFLRATSYPVNVYTTTTSTNFIGDTTLHLTSGANVYLGMTGIITDGTNYDTFQVTYRVGLTVTISPPLTHAYDSGSNFIGKTLFLPYNCERRLSVIRQGDGGQMLVVDSQQRKDYYNPYDTTTSKPTVLIVEGKSFATLTGLTLKTGTTTTLALTPGLIYADNTTNFYKDWTFKNDTRKNHAYVTASVLSGTSDVALTLDRPIASQVATDSFTLIDERLMYELYPAPDAQYQFRLEYFRSKIPPLVNLTDSPLIPDDWMNNLVEGIIAKAKSRDDEQYALMKGQQFGQFLDSEFQKEKAPHEQRKVVRHWGLPRFNDTYI